MVDWNSALDIIACLAALDLTAVDEVVVVDNGSSSENAALLVDALHEYGGRLLSAEVNRGFGSGANIGLTALRHLDVVVIVNPDARPASDCVHTLADHLGRHPEVAAVAPLILNQDGRVWYAGGYFDPWQGRVRLPGFGQPPSALATGSTEFVSGCIIALRQTALLEVGLFDEDLFLYYEDVDLSRRLRAAGWELHIVVEAQAVHRRGEFGDPDRHLGPVALRYTMASRTRYVRGHLSGLRLAFALAFTPFMAFRLAALVVSARDPRLRSQLFALLHGTFEGFRQPAARGSGVGALTDLA